MHIFGVNMDYNLVARGPAKSLRILCVLFILSLAACTATQNSEQSTDIHPSWDSDGDGVNDCEIDGSCDHTVDYRLARNTHSGPSFDCTSGALTEVETQICHQGELALLDRKLAKVYKQAKAVSNEPTPGPSFLQVEQRGWLKGRNECWQSEALVSCISDTYIRRIAQLQARYGLVSSTGPIRFQCTDSPADELVVTYFETDPPTLISERGDTVSLMYQTPSASGSRYLGRNESFWQHQDEVTLHWGANNAALHCQQVSE
jgi:uncharacterized protein